MLKDYSIQSAACGAPSSTVEEASAQTARFTILNPGSGDEYALSDIPVLDDGRWHDCKAGKVALPWQLVSCQYSLDRASGHVGFRLQWFCDDLDADNAYVCL